MIVSGIGLGTVFVVLILLGIAIAVLDRLDSVLASKEDQEPEPAPEIEPPPAVEETGVPREVVAAIGLAIALAQQESSAPAVAPARSDTTGSWLQSGRFREMAARSAGTGRKA